MCHLPTDLAAICMRCAMYSTVVLAPVGCHCSFKYLSLKQSGRWSSRCLLYQREMTFICSSPKLFFCVQVPSAAITTPAELDYAPAPPQMWEAKLVWLLAPRDAAFGRCCWTSVSAHPGGCTELCQASVVLNAGSKHCSGIAWNRELCKSNLGGCGRLAFFLDYSKCRVLLAFPCFCLQTREEAAGERQTSPAENGNGKLALANASCLHF